MWHAAQQLGVAGEGVRVLEPGCGSGNFIGFAPDSARVTGVELDQTTAEIAQHLYGARATIHATAFEELRVEDGAFDTVIGNVPFAKVTPHDPRHNRGRHALHNYFLIKSLHLTRPGGLVVALTSRYTLDARNSAARRQMASMADLVGAIRLPEQAFARSSGTDVVVDMVILRRRPPGAEPFGPAWQQVGAAPTKTADDAPRWRSTSTTSPTPNTVAPPPRRARRIMRRVRPRVVGFHEDPDWPLVAALESFDEESQQARPATIFHERVIDPPHERHGVDSPERAVAVCLDETGTVTVER